MHKHYSSSSSSSGGFGKGCWTRIAIVAFILLILICLGLAAALIFTSQPVDVNRRSEAWNQHTPRPIPNNSTFYRRKPLDYRPFTKEHLSGRGIVLTMQYTTKYLDDGSILVADESGAYTQWVGGSMCYAIREENGTITSLRHTCKNKGMPQYNIVAPDSIIEKPFLSMESNAQISANRRYIEIQTYPEHIYRYSTQYKVEFGEISGTIVKSRFLMDDSNATMVNLFKWSPAVNDNDFVYVSNYNIYYQADPTKPGTAVAITQGGSDFDRYGLADWLYEEEILGSSDAIWWSPSGSHIAFARFNNTLVNRVYIATYQDDHLYPDFAEIAYPKAGVANPEVTLYMWNKATGQQVIIKPPEELENGPYYLFSSSWLSLPSHFDDGERLLSVWSNREQNHVYITLCSQNDCISVFNQAFTIKSRKMWAEPNEFRSVFATKRGFLAILPHPYKDGNIYNHIAHVEIRNDGTGRVSQWLGEAYDVKTIGGYDIHDDTVSYTVESQGLASHRLFAVYNATSSDPQIRCVSCAVPDCDGGTFSVSPTGARALLTCSAVFQSVNLYLVDFHHYVRHKNYTILREAKPVEMPFTLPEITYDTVEIGSGLTANAMLMKPPKFDPALKYSVFLNVYGGPNTVGVKRSLPWDFLLYICSTFQVVIITIDGRGSASRGWNYKEPLYRRFGTVERDDQILAVRSLAAKYQFLDLSRSAVMGWSYGGFLSSHIALADGGATFKCAIAVAPVADFKMYDSAYTERYMGLPADNPSGYNASCLLDKIQGLKGVEYMLVHGEADDNVHYQHSALLARKLQDASIDFRQLVYTNEDHSIGQSRPHLYMQIAAFLVDKCQFTP